MARPYLRTKLTMRHRVKKAVLILLFVFTGTPLILGPTCITPMGSQGGDGGSSEGSDFHETWAPAVTGSSYLPDMDPPAQIRGSEGNWYLSATITVADNTPHYAEVVGDGDAKCVKVVSNRSNTDKADNIWLWWDKRLSGKTQSIPITPDTRVSFAEEGELHGSPESIGWGTDNCGVLTCGICFVVADANGNGVTYRLQRPTDAWEHTSAHHVEILVEPVDGVYSRNLYEDFSRIPAFDPNDAVIQYMGLEINPWEWSTDELGWATIDDIKITHGTE